MPPDSAACLLKSYELGTAQMEKFVEQRLNTNEVKFWDALPNLKIKTYATMIQKKKVKTTDEKLVTVSADRDLFGRLMIAAKAKDIRMKEVLTYELSAVPFSLAHSDGSLRKTDKSVLLTELEKKVDVQPRLPQVASSNQMSTAHIFDGMALVQMVKSSGAVTFGDMASKYYNLITAPISRNGCRRVDVVFAGPSVSQSKLERERN